MEIAIVSLDGKKSGSVQLSEAIFGLEPRADLLHCCVNWQLAKRRRGTHKAKDRGEISRTGKKMYSQKGTGQARHSSARVNLFRGGGRSFGPVVRSHATDLPKQLRSLALKHALSSKAKSADLIVIDEAKLGAPKTKSLAKNLEKLGVSSALVIDGAEVERNFGLAARNLPDIDVLPVKGINVYDILRRTKLVLTRAAVEALEARLK